jgi:ZIP family zinc transporter
MEQNVLFAFLLTLLAGLATGIGGLIALFAKRTNKSFLSFSLGLSAGVMIYVSFVELLRQAEDLLTIEIGKQAGLILTATCFFLGMLFIAIIDKLVPSHENPHEMRSIESMHTQPPKDQKLMKMGIITAIAITIHNFPEGIAIFISAMENPSLGIVIAVAIAIHNIPEGIAVSVPVFHATGNKKKAFYLAFLPGLAEPIGAGIAYLFLAPFISPFILGCVFAFVAGIMIFISFDELLPAAHEYGKHHISIYGLIIGMMVMAISLILLI